MLRNAAIIILMILLIQIPCYGDELPERYHTYQEIVDTLTVLGNMYPDAICIDTMGYSQRDTIPMLRVKLSDNPSVDEDEPAIQFNGGVHADEVLGVEVVMNFIYDYLSKYAERVPEIMNYHHELEIMVIPMINPEGHIVVENGDTEWRKNKSDNDSNGVFDFHDGVDNNRNYDFGWDIDDENNSTTPESLMFKGHYPFSESENRAMREHGWRYRPLIGIDYHSPTYGRSEVAYYPWYWYSNQGGHGFGPDENMMLGICRGFCGSIINDDGDSTYEARRALVNKGDFKTYYYGNFGTVAFTCEVSDTTIQDPEMIDDIVTRHLPGQYYLIERAMGAGITGVIRDSVTLEFLEAEVQVLEHINEDINPRLSRPDHGRYRRLLDSGTYRLKFLKDDYRTQTITGVSVNSQGPTEVNILLEPLHPRPRAPELAYPASGDSLEENLFTFDWDESELAEVYLIEVSDNPDFSNIIIIDSTVTNSEFEVTTPLDDGEYFWRIKGGNNNGWGPYTVVSNFFVDFISGVEDNNVLPSGFRLYQNHPNPFNPETQIKFLLPTDGNVTLNVYNLAGQVITTLVNKKMEAGRHTANWDASKHSSGLYFYRLQTGDISDVKKMVLLK